MAKSPGVRTLQRPTASLRSGQKKAAVITAAGRRGGKTILAPTIPPTTHSSVETRERQMRRSSGKLFGSFLRIKAVSGNYSVGVEVFSSLCFSRWLAPFPLRLRLLAPFLLK
jgi:hypothetical protein